MFRTEVQCQGNGPLALVDRIASGYVLLPLAIFFAGWFRWWAALPLLACFAWSVRPLVARVDTPQATRALTRLQIICAVGVGCGWTMLGGLDHIVFANADWHIRDAVLHDLVASPWPVGYGHVDGRESILRAPLAFYLPAACIGKVLGLGAAHLALLIWTCCGASLFLVQVLSLTPARTPVVLTVVGVVVLFSGLDIVGSLLNEGPRFRMYWHITDHLEWWAGSYQYSAMSTQLFWVPNHALGGWLIVGLLYRCRGAVAFIELLPALVVAVALWSPFAAIGITPFAAALVFKDMAARHCLGALHPRILLPVIPVAIALGAYLVLGAGSIPSGYPAGRNSDVLMSLLNNLQFFLLEAGILGILVLLLRPAAELCLALLVLLLLPWFSFGAANDFVMRASIPSLAVMTVCTVLSLTTRSTVRRASGLRYAAAAVLLVGAVTPLEEMARALLFPRWPINLTATLVGADCGRRAPHYVAKISEQPIAHLLSPPHDIDLGPQGPAACDNPAFDVMWLGPNIKSRKPT